MGSAERDSRLERKEKRLDLRLGCVVLVHVRSHPHVYLIGIRRMKRLNTFLLRDLGNAMSGVLIEMAGVFLADE